MQLKSLALLLALAALSAYGCSPTQLGDRELTADKPLLNNIEEYGQAKLTSSGESLTITITIPPANDTCKGTFKFIQSESAYPLLNMLPGFASGPSLYYQGTFDGTLSAKCLALLGSPGGTPMEAIVQQPIMAGTDNLWICSSAQRTGKSCVGGAVYTINDL